jgi:hypothetical protein
MKNPFHSVPGASLLAVMFFAIMAVLAAPPEIKRKSDAQMSGTNDIPQSTFSIPAAPQEGRDPFFPNSFHGAASTALTQTPSAAAEALVLNGIGGTPDHKLAMINGRTMAEGETNEINTVAGRVRIHCIEIKGESAVVEVVGGERRELHLRD